MTVQEILEKELANPGSMITDNTTEVIEKLEKIGLTPSDEDESYDCTQYYIFINRELDIYSHYLIIGQDFKVSNEDFVEVAKMLKERKS